MLLTVLFFSTLLQAEAAKPLATVASVDLNRYLGVWHEIARYPNWFQKGCDQATAQYTLLADGTLEVRNTCVEPGGNTRSVLGQARVVDQSTHAKLKVSFVPAWLRWTGIGWGDYWVVDLAEYYSYAVVSEPGRKYLWILNREPVMQKETYGKILERLKELGFDTAKLMASRQGAVLLKDMHR
jgi:apolipoprotein D and lipocalin family protein